MCYTNETFISNFKYKPTRYVGVQFVNRLDPQYVYCNVLSIVCRWAVKKFPPLCTFAVRVALTETSS
jgi:hypothetical protein